MIAIRGHLSNMVELGERGAIHKCGAVFCQPDDGGNPRFFLKVEVSAAQLKLLGGYEFRAGQVVEMELSGEVVADADEERERQASENLAKMRKELAS